MGGQRSSATSGTRIGAPISPPPVWQPSMTEGEAQAYVESQGSKYLQPVYHVTKPENVESIRRSGFRPADSSWGKMWGLGTYFSLEPSGFWQTMVGGDIWDENDQGLQEGVHFSTVKAYLNLQKPLVVDIDSFGERSSSYEAYHPHIVSKALGIPLEDARKRVRAVTRDMGGAVNPRYRTNEGIALSSILKNAGYDGLILRSFVHSSFGGNQAIVFDPKRIVIVE